MGNLCDCLSPPNSQNDDRPSTTEYTPLLKGGFSAAGAATTSQPTSARTNRARLKKNTGNPLDELAPVEVRDCRLTHLNKLFKDHAKLFNNILDKRNSMVEEIAAIKSETFPDTPTTSSLQDCFKEMRKQCDGLSTHVTLERKYKHCMEIVFDSALLSGSIPTVSAFMHFNQANQLAKEIMDKSTAVADSIQLVVHDEDQLRRDILTASLGADGPRFLKNCNENITDLRKLPGLLESIMKEAAKNFEDLKNGVQPLLSES